jgi:hypothetical protein
MSAHLSLAEAYRKNPTKLFPSGFPHTFPELFNAKICRFDGAEIDNLIEGRGAGTPLGLF